MTIKISYLAYEVKNFAHRGQNLSLQSSRAAGLTKTVLSMSTVFVFV